MDCIGFLFNSGPACLGITKLVKEEIDGLFILDVGDPSSDDCVKQAPIQD